MYLADRDLENILAEHGEIRFLTHLYRADHTTPPLAVRTATRPESYGLVNGNGMLLAEHLSRDGFPVDHPLYRAKRIKRINRHIGTAAHADSHVDHFAVSSHRVGTGITPIPQVIFAEEIRLVLHGDADAELFYRLQLFVRRKRQMADCPVQLADIGFISLLQQQRNN